MKLKDACSLEEKLWQTYIMYWKAEISLCPQKSLWSKIVFFSSHVWMWELYCKEGQAPKNWCFQIVWWRETLRVPWTAKRSNQSVLKEINHVYSLEGLMLKLQYFSYLMRRADSLEKTLMLGKIGGKKRRGQQKMKWLESITNSVDMNLSKLWEIVEDRQGAE